jgi:hypothetical protein
MGASPFECDVDSGGISHVFGALAVGAVCACGRTVAALSEDERRLELRCVDPWPAPVRSRTDAVRPSARVCESDRLLLRGGDAIAQARSLRALVLGQRAERCVQRARRERARAR